MGENNVTLGPGTLFIKHPDDQDWQSFGTVQEGSVEYHELPEEVPAVVKVPDPAEISTECMAPPDMAKLLAEIAEAYKKLWEEIKRAWDAVVGTPDISFICAYAWATVHRPEWVRVLNRTKKRRIRKKYQDRILRAYQKEE